ncbi:UNVERIFIED_CONTAM: hypothetical protein Scaly_2393500 [Sesamum calycinum]|uniref:PLAC8 family protein n=1 Tax=Sesamum calycinum TaxID=2727403 RepID=A0AAW2M0J9_9LAMI
MRPHVRQLDMQLRQNYRNLWHTPHAHHSTGSSLLLLGALVVFLWPDSSLGFGTRLTRVDFDGPCVSYMLRKRALYNDMSRYVCCAGYMPCSGRCGESRCPEFCLATEVFLCFANSVASTRFMLQDEFNIQTTQCDNCIIGFMFCLQQIACIFSIVAMIVGSEEISEASQILSCLSDLTQHKVEMDKRDGKFGPQPAMAVPAVQQMSRLDQPYPPTVGYPPPAYGGQPTYPPAYGQPNYPPQGAGYPPPAGYPPAGYQR